MTSHIGALRPDTQRALGAVVMAGSFLEDSTRQLLQVLLDSPHGGYIAAGTGFDRAREQILRLLKVSAPAERYEAQIAEWLASAKKAWGERNEAVHGVWLPVKGQDQMVVYRSRFWSLEETSRPIGVADLERIGRELDSAAIALGAIATRISPFNGPL